MKECQMWGKALKNMGGGVEYWEREVKANNE